MSDVDEALLIHMLKSRQISRREFVRQGLMLGLSLGAVQSLLAACAPKPAPSPTEVAPAATATPLPTQVAGPTGTITYVSAMNFLGWWNPFMNLHLPHMRSQRMVYDYLMWFDEEGNTYPGLATSFENVSPTVWEVKLREGVKFHDGQDFTAKDVKASVEMASNPNYTTGALFPEQLSVEVVDDYTARIITPAPFAALKGATLCANQSAAMISHEDAEKGDDWMNQRMNGTGPFKWVDYKSEVEGLRLTANINYWRGVPKVKDVVMKYVSDASTRLSMLRAGQADILEGLAPDEGELLSADPDFKVMRTLSTDSLMVAFRSLMPPMDNVYLRRAICYAINVQSIVDNILLGYGKVNQAFIPEMTMYFKPDPDYFSYDPDRAKSLLAEAGYPDGEGLPELLLSVPMGAYPKVKEYAEFIAQNIQDIGVNVRLELREGAAFWDEALTPDSGTVHMVLHGWLVPTPDRNSWYTTMFRGGLVNGFSDEELTSVIYAQTEATDPQERQNIIQNQLEPLLVELAPSYPMFSYELTTATPTNIEGLVIPPWYEFDMFPVSKT